MSYGLVAFCSVNSFTSLVGGSAGRTCSALVTCYLRLLAKYGCGSWLALMYMKVGKCRVRVGRQAAVLYVTPFV